MTQTQSKAQQVFNDLWKSLGGSGANPDVAQFKSQLSSASDEQMIEASEHWKQILQPLIHDANPPSTIVEEVALFSDDLVRRYRTVATGAMTDR